MRRYTIEQDPDGTFAVLYRCDDGINDWLSSHATRAEAGRAIREYRADLAALDSAERHYRAQYEHACGY